MSMAWSVPGLSVLRTDGGVSPSMTNAGKSSQKNDNGFASLMEVRGSLNNTAPPAPNAETTLAEATGLPTDRLQHRALAALNTLSGGTLDRAKTGMQGILLNGGSLQRARGIALDDRSGGIALDPSQRRTLEQRRAAAQAETAAPVKRAPRTGSRRAADSVEDGLGKLAARFESGRDGVAAIGYDRVGGTSYGKYQIASRPGSMNMFMNFLKTNDPGMADRLAAAGPANTGSTKGEMPTVWKAIAAESPEYFEKLQAQFIRESHYEPAREALEEYGYKTKDFSPAMQEVLFSTAVQHGPAGAARIFSQAADMVGLKPTGQHEQEKDVIRQVYALRADRFGSSTPQIQAAARQRMVDEGRIALAMS